MTYLNWIMALYTESAKSDKDFHKTHTTTIMVDLVFNMDNEKLRYLTDLNRTMGMKDTKEICPKLKEVEGEL